MTVTKLRPGQVTMVFICSILKGVSGRIVVVVVRSGAASRGVCIGLSAGQEYSAAIGAEYGRFRNQMQRLPQLNRESPAHSAPWPRATLQRMKNDADARTMLSPIHSPRYRA
ncbi:hypothetical protein [Cupriavidus sp. H39]|uniref:hypothetical protein n=1 Tax=Cupriavidus sp. H39 TaxID=3401635 RepID=UPI003D0023CB